MRNFVLPLILTFSREGRRVQTEPPHPSLLPQGEKGQTQPPHPSLLPRRGEGTGQPPHPSLLPQGEKGAHGAGAKGDGAGARKTTAVKLLLVAAVAALWLALGTGGAGAQTVVDDHGNTYDTATDVALGTSVEVRIDPGHERDVFRIDLSGESGDTDLWVYATSDEYDTFAGLYDSDGTLIELNDDSFFLGDIRSFSIRSVVPPGVYYLIVVSYAGEPGEFTLHAQGVTAPGSTAETAAALSLDSPVGGRIDAADDADYFKLEFTDTTHVIIDATTADIVPIDAALLDADGEELSENISLIALRGFGLPFPIGFQIRESFEPGTYYLRVALPVLPEPEEPAPEDPAPEPDDEASSIRPVTYSVFLTEDTEYTEFLEECAAATSGLNDPEISDPLFACQWHLGSSEWANVNAEPAWADGVKGEGVNVAVVDDGMYHEHEDLKDNVNAELNRDYTGNEDIYSRFEHHGTNVSGMIAARDNDIGVRGVAPRATIYGYNLLAPGAFTLLNVRDAMTANHEVTGVSNNSWGPFDGPELSAPFPFWTEAIDLGITAGNDGKGVFYAFAAGNGHLLGDDSNLDGMANYFGVTAVCSVHSGGSRAGYSEMGANLWVCAPSNDRPRSLGGVRGIVTTENSDRYYQDFGGTSAATPIVAGVAALMRSANPDLTWRDLKLILAATTQKNDAASSGWEDGAVKYRSGSDADRYHFNHEYGFGLADAGAAVDLAQEWTNLPALMASAAESEWESVEIPDAPDAGEATTVERTVTIDTSIGFTEFVEVTLAFQHDAFRDLEVELVSPSGAVSRLSVPYDTYIGLGFFFDPFVPLHGEFRFGSARHLGEDPNGEWTLRVTDEIPAIDGILDGMAITVYGHERVPGAPEAPAIEANVQGGTLTVAWAAPGETGGSAITAYDLRHIETGEDETDDSSWTVVEDAWTAEAGGDLEHTITGLTDGTEYDVQVRAVNDSGAGLWSATAVAAPKTSICVSGGAVADGADRPGLARDCEALLEARDALAGTATLDWSAETPISDWQGVGFDEDGDRVTWVALRNEGLNGTIPASLGRLSMVMQLILHSNDLTGGIPAELGGLAHLEKLLLHNNRLTGPIPDLSGASSLKMLWLSGTDMALTDGVPTWLNSMGSLESLSLWGNNLGGEMPDLSGMSSLKELRLQSTGLTGEIPASLGNVTSLVDLYLHSNELTGEIPVELGQLTSLGHISLHTNSLTGSIPAELSGMASLVDLNLHNNQLSGSIPGGLGDLSNLTHLRLNDNRLSGSIPAEFGKLSMLQGLWLQDNRLSRDIPAELGGLSNLTHLYLGGTNSFSGCLPAGLRDVANNDLDSLILSYCPAP